MNSVIVPNSTYNKKEQWTKENGGKGCALFYHIHFHNLNVNHVILLYLGYSSSTKVNDQGQSVNMVQAGKDNYASKRSALRLTHEAKKFRGLQLGQKLGRAAREFPAFIKCGTTTDLFRKTWGTMTFDDEESFGMVSSALFKNKKDEPLDHEGVRRMMYQAGFVSLPEEHSYAHELFFPNEQAKIDSIKQNHRVAIQRVSTSCFVDYLSYATTN